MTEANRVAIISRVCAHQSWHIRAQWQRLTPKAICTFLLASASSRYRTSATDCSFEPAVNFRHKLQVVHNAVAWLVIGVTTVANLKTSDLSNLHWLPIKQVKTFQTSLLAQKCLPGKAPSRLAQLRVPLLSARRRRRSHAADADQLGVQFAENKRTGNRRFKVQVTWHRLWGGRHFSTSNHRHYFASDPAMILQNFNQPAAICSNEDARKKSSTCFS